MAKTLEEVDFGDYGLTKNVKLLNNESTEQLMKVHNDRHKHRDYSEKYLRNVEFTLAYRKAIKRHELKESDYSFQDLKVLETARTGKY